MSKYGFEMMEVGDVLAFDGHQKKVRATNAAKGFFRRKNWNLEVRSTSSGVLISRKSGQYGSNKTGTFRGNSPDKSDGWSELSRCESDGANWIIFQKPQSEGSSWITYKIVADGRAEKKANYWLVRNKETGQIGYAKDYANMRENRQDLHMKVENAIRKA